MAFDERNLPSQADGPNQYTEQNYSMIPYLIVVQRDRKNTKNTLLCNFRQEITPVNKMNGCTIVINMRSSCFKGFLMRGANCVIVHE